MSTGKVPIDYPDKYGNTAIHYATYKGHFDFLKTCIEEFNANLLLYNNGGQSPLLVMTHEHYM
jgi:ankyrin repeat protein